MPPRKNSIAPRTKPGRESKSGKDIKPGKDIKTGSKQAKQNTKDVDKVNPFQRSAKNMSRAGDIRRQRDTYNEIIAEEQAQRANEIKDLEERILYYKRDNEKLLRQQTVKYGTTLDGMKVIREELDQSRLANDSLYREVESRKEECDKLQNEMDLVLSKINEHMIECSDLNRERRIFEHEREQVARNEIRIHQLVQANKDLRAQLLKNKINPNTDASRIHIKSSSPRSEKIPSDPTLPMIYNKHNLLSVRSEADLLSHHKKAKKPLKGILRRTRSNNSTEYMSAKEFFNRRPSYPWTRAVDVNI
jgi:hypothetical protein